MHEGRVGTAAHVMLCLNWPLLARTLRMHARDAFQIRRRIDRQLQAAHRLLHVLHTGPATGVDALCLHQA